MFETSQQEPSGGDTKVIVGVVAVVVIALAVVYFMFLRGQPSTAPTAGVGPAAAPAANTPAPDAQPAMDLAIEKSNLGRDETQTMAVWELEINNRSHEITYRNIKYATKYYDAAGQLVYQGGGTLPGQLGPGEERSIGGINDGLYPVNTARYTVEITGAQGFK